MNRREAPAGAAAGEVVWEPWTPGEVRGRLQDLAVPWCVAGGWAIDLFAGRQTREHHDLEVAVPRSSWDRVWPQLPDLRFWVVHAGRLRPPDETALEESFQTWGLDKRGVARVDIFRELDDGVDWVYRRDPEIRRPYASTIELDRAGIPYLVPEIVLLFKAKHDRDQDRQDLHTALPLMARARRGWLQTSLQRAHPGHPWLSDLENTIEEDGRQPPGRR